MKNSLTQSSKELKTLGNRNPELISLYDDELATVEDIAKAMIVLRELFSVSKSFTVIVSQRVLEKRFTKKRLQDAINNVIDHHKYPTLIPAAILDYDKTTEVKTHKQMQELSDWSDWERMDDGRYKKIK